MMEEIETVTYTEPQILARNSRPVTEQSYRSVAKQSQATVAIKTINMIPETMFSCIFA